MPDDYPTDWNSRRKAVYKRDNYTCQNCGRKGGPRGNTELHAHHVVPKSKGGVHSAENLVTVCRDCHNAIHSDSLAPTAKEKQANTGSSGLGGHGKVFLLTFWWTGGLGNLVYAAFKHSKNTPTSRAKVTKSTTKQIQHRYGGCPDCPSSYTLKYGLTFHRELASPFVIRCKGCRSEFKGEGNRLRPLDEYVSNIDNDVSSNWYHALVTGISLSLLTGIFPFPSLIISAYVLIPTSIFYDTKYVRHETELNPVTPVWVWTSLVWIFPVNALAGVAYLLRRYSSDSTESSLHRGPVWTRIGRLVAKVHAKLPASERLSEWQNETLE